MPSNHDQFATRQRASFVTTRWSLVVAAGAAKTESKQAIAELCELYWYPLYAFTRRWGLDRDAAADAVQGFFAELLEGNLLRSADPSKGRFRSYALGALKHFLSDERERATAKKRGAGAIPISLSDAEARYDLEPAHHATAEKLFDREWAMTLLQMALTEFGKEYSEPQQHRQFERLKDLLAGPLPDRSYAEIAAELGMTEGAVKIAVHRMRHRYRQILEHQIAQTLDSPSEIEDELRHLHAAISTRL